MKKKILFILVIIFVLALFYLVGSGFSNKTSVILIDYSLSEDEKILTLYTSVESSVGYVRSYNDEGGGEKPHYLKFYSTFGGLNSSYGSKNEFVLELSPTDTEVYFYRGDGNYKMVLKKNEYTGEWEVPTKDK